MSELEAPGEGWGVGGGFSLRLSECTPGQIAHLSKTALSSLLYVIRTRGWPKHPQYLLIWELQTQSTQTLAFHTHTQNPTELPLPTNVMLTFCYSCIFPVFVKIRMMIVFIIRYLAIASFFF